MTTTFLLIIGGGLIVVITTVKATYNITRWFDRRLMMPHHPAYYQPIVQMPLYAQERQRDEKVHNKKSKDGDSLVMLMLFLFCLFIAVLGLKWLKNQDVVKQNTTIEEEATLPVNISDKNYVNQSPN